MWNRWVPWRWFVSRLARSRGFIDPFELQARLQRFAQPAEVSEPIELLRAGVVFHARGLLNARVIQHNLDWVWPFWVERQFSPLDPAFVPRAFSITHVNLTHRNWTAVGVPDVDALPIVDPRGLTTPHLDGWSLDAWLVPDDEEPLFPSRAADVRQELLLADVPTVRTVARHAGAELVGLVDVAGGPEEVRCRVRYTARSPRAGYLAVAVRPANPEGVHLVHTIRQRADRTTFVVDDEDRVHFDRAPHHVRLSDYHRGDVFRNLRLDAHQTDVSCPVGLATAAALFRVDAGVPLEVTAEVPLPGMAADPAPAAWRRALDGACRMEVPDERYRFLFDAAVRTLVLHSPGLVYPGPSTYKRFWFRDAAFILDALLALGLVDRVGRCLAEYPDRQDLRGYFRSQEGEWDSNGAALWIIDRHRRVTGTPLDARLLRAVVRGADWIGRKRVADSAGVRHAGLMPAGFSAEHLGLNDFYYWDDFWSAAGLRAAAALGRDHGHAADAGRWERQADELLAAVDHSMCDNDDFRAGRGVPASPYRRMDAGAIGNLAASYPLRLWRERDDRLLRTVDYLMRHCWVRGGFFQEMIHSGINAYLTLHVAQVLLRAGDRRCAELIRAVADLASSTGQWPEAIHPRTDGGCMGDGQHVWAAAEWVLMMRALFVREEGDRLLVGTGVPPEWLAAGAVLRLGPTPTPFGPVSVEIAADGPATTRVRCRGAWRGSLPPLEARLPGHEPRPLSADSDVLVPRSA
ncbi:MAG: hypothetical protein U0736_22380 [Gemmataceae bacterium]